MRTCRPTCRRPKFRYKRAQYMERRRELACEWTCQPSAAPVRERLLLKLAEVVTATKLSRTGIYEKMKLKTFPDSVKMGVRATAWYEDEVDDWIASPR